MQKLKSMTKEMFDTRFTNRGHRFKFEDTLFVVKEHTDCYLKHSEKNKCHCKSIIVAHNKTANVDQLFCPFYGPSIHFPMTCFLKYNDNIIYYKTSFEDVYELNNNIWGCLWFRADNWKNENKETRFKLIKEILIQ